MGNLDNLEQSVRVVDDLLPAVQEAQELLATALGLFGHLDDALFTPEEYRSAFLTMGAVASMVMSLDGIKEEVEAIGIALTAQQEIKDLIEGGAK